MAISSHGNSNSVQPRFTIDDLDSIDKFINTLERNGCYIVSKSQLEDMSNGFPQRPVTEYDYINQQVYCPSSIDRTLYSMESNYDVVCMDLETDFHISNLDGPVVFKMDIPMYAKPKVYDVSPTEWLHEGSHSPAQVHSRGIP